MCMECINRCVLSVLLVLCYAKQLYYYSLTVFLCHWEVLHFVYLWLKGKMKSPKPPPGTDALIKNEQGVVLNLNSYFTEGIHILHLGHLADAFIQSNVQ